jgi:hypothetical protein
MNLTGDRDNSDLQTEEPRWFQSAGLMDTRYSSNSHPAEPRVDLVSRLEET